MSKSQTFQLQNAQRQQRTADKYVVVVAVSSSCSSSSSSSTCASSTSMATKHTFTLFAITFSRSPFRRVLFAKFDAQLHGIEGCWWGGGRVRVGDLDRRDLAMLIKIE